MKVSINKIRDTNDDIGLGRYGVLSAIRYKIALKYVSDLCVENKRICEIGPGGVIIYISKYSKADTSAIVSPRERHWDEIFKTHNIDHLKWDLNTVLSDTGHSNYFDCVIFLETLEHLNRWPEHIINDIHKLIKPGGYLLMSTPNLVRLSNRFRMLLGRPPNNPFKYTDAGEHHVREYTLGELKEFFPKKKWIIDKTSYEFPHSIGNNGIFKLLTWPFKKVVGTIIFIRVQKRDD